jgi:hypothetical protein
MHRSDALAARKGHQISTFCAELVRLFTAHDAPQQRHFKHRRQLAAPGLPSYWALMHHLSAI